MTRAEEYLEEVRERLDNLTKLPWDEWGGRDVDGTYHYGLSPEDDIETEIARFPHTPQGAEDMEFFANAPRDLKKLYKFALDILESTRAWEKSVAYPYGPGAEEAAYASGYQSAMDTIVDSLKDTAEEHLHE